MDLDIWFSIELGFSNLILCKIWTKIISSKYELTHLWSEGLFITFYLRKEILLHIDKDKALDAWKTSVSSMQQH